VKERNKVEGEDEDIEDEDLGDIDE
jgi:hypothetical protein